MPDSPRNSCIRCGTCCLKGGPTLHHEDKRLLLEGHAGYEHLVTIRKGELVFDPVLGVPRPADQELVKVRGKGNGWSCCLFDERSSACRVYEHRFLECRLLKCWDPADLVAAIGVDTIVRTDIINPGDPVRQVIAAHEEECPPHEVQALIASLSRGDDRSKTLAALAGLARKDLAVRHYARTELGLKAEYEYFIFGRPLSRILASHGIMVHTLPGG
ncbi:MAG: YkgJ family cysteine cluster protein [Bacillota bacterium]